MKKHLTIHSSRLVLIAVIIVASFYNVLAMDDSANVGLNSLLVKRSLAPIGQLFDQSYSTDDEDESAGKYMKKETSAEEDADFLASVSELAAEQGYSIHDANGCYYLDKIGFDLCTNGPLAPIFEKAKKSSTFASIAELITTNNMYSFPALTKINEFKMAWVEKINQAVKLSAKNKYNLYLEKIIDAEQELKKAMVNNYKIHLMPYPDDTVDVLTELMDLFKHIPELMGIVSSFKVAKNPYRLYELGSNFPIIVIYVAGKDKAQQILNALVDWFRDEKLEGMDKTPRHNQKVTDMVYWAQGDGDEKKANSSCFEEQPPCAESDTYVCFKSDFTGEEMNHWLDISALKEPSCSDESDSFEEETSINESDPSEEETSSDEGDTIE